ncbi:hypothetical protein [Burkholderia sp. LMG 32019]|uniref:hypothetical protein n=1 Tax=Burkholderia sp. LMG 32019 TaxID=3158173 RepID=UPI003C308DDD
MQASSAAARHDIAARRGLAPHEVREIDNPDQRVETKQIILHYPQKGGHSSLGPLSVTSVKNAALLYTFKPIQLLLKKEVNMVLLARQVMLVHFFSTSTRSCLSSIALR